MNIRQPAVPVNQNVNKICCPLDNASFGTFCIQIGQLLESYHNESLKLREFFCLASILLQKCQNSAFDWAFKDPVQCDSNNWPIGMQNLPNEALSIRLQILSIFSTADQVNDWLLSEYLSSFFSFELASLYTL